MGIRSWAVAIALASMSADALSASFPCYKASSYAEVTVCSANQLSHQDEVLAALYQRALARLPDPNAVQWVQKNWLESDRNQCRTVQCVKDSYARRIFGLRRQLGEPTLSTIDRYGEPASRSPARHAEVAATPMQGSPSDIECANLNAAVKTALNSGIPAASLMQFNGRVVTGWRQSDYEAFLGALDACSTRAETAPELNVFPDEARTLLTTLRERAVRVGAEPDIAAKTSLSNTAGVVAAEAVAKNQERDVADWTFTRNADGVVMASATRNAMIYLGNDCDAMSPQYGNGAWTYGNAEWSVKVGTEQFKFLGNAPPLVSAKCEARTKSPPALQAMAVPVQVQKPRLSSASVTHSSPATPVTSEPSPARTTIPATQGSESNASTGNFLSALLVTWVGIVIAGVVCGFKGTIVVYRNFDDLAIVFFMGVLLLAGGLSGFYFSGLKDSFATPLLWGIAVLGTMILFGWTIARTWRDQQPASVWRFALALITKISLGILFLNNLVTLISPSGKTLGARSRARGTALLFLAVLTPIVLRLVRNHDGVWAPHNLLSSYHRRRMGI